MLPPIPPPPRPSEEFRRLAELCAGDTVTFKVLMGEMRPRDHALLTLVLSAAFLHPIPMMGLSVPLGLVIVCAGARMALGKGPWVPAAWRERPMPARLFRTVFGAFAAVMRPVERLIRPRGRFLTEHPWVRRANGLGLAAAGSLIMIPLPPPTNFPPALAGFVLSAGVLEEDLLFVGLGWGLLALNALLFGAIAVYGLDGIAALWGYLV